MIFLPSPYFDILSEDGLGTPKTRIQPDAVDKFYTVRPVVDEVFAGCVSVLL
jgi:hypothetical protein